MQNDWFHWTAKYKTFMTEDEQCILDFSKRQTFSVCTQSVYQLCLIFGGLLRVQKFFLASESHLKVFWLLGRL